MEIERKVNELLEIRKQLISLANMQYTPETCPLATQGTLDHHELSGMLFGEGYCWTCKFCGVEHGDSY